MEKKLKIFLTTIAVIALSGLAGCSKTDGYTPSATASGEEIFNMNCTGCHKPLSDGIIALSENMVTKDAIINKVQNGSMRMTAFPNIQGEPADRLADYVLKNSRPK
ncbi:MAG: cytochrome c [Nitrosomonas sp.]|jgi:cytochrome c551|nr:cytochrome c [Nitrosomonas sp.]